MSRENFLKECRTVQDNCTYTAEAHHIIAADSAKLSFWLQLVPAVLAALSGILVVGQVVPVWFGWLTVTSSVVSAVTSVLNPLKSYYDNLNAAKGFTILKQDARALRETLSGSMNDRQLETAVRDLLARYDDLVRVVPPTTDDAFERARKRVRQGIHEPDRKR